jgi:hypothetical protein
MPRAPVFLKYMTLPFAALFSMASYAQSGLEVQQPASALECLTPTIKDRGSPTYPAESLRMKEGARLLVQLTFESAQEPPVTKILQKTGEDEFAVSVKDFVKQYRLPCLAPGEKPVRASQEFVFDPGDGRTVVYGAITGEPRPPTPKSCFSLPDGAPHPSKNALRRGEGGTIMASVTFDQPNEVPKVRILYDANSPLLKESVEAHVEKYRFVCPLPEGKPVHTIQLFDFKVEGAARYAFPDVGLKEFLQMVESVDLTNAKFDTSEMSCPFDLSINVRRPHMKNLVGEFGVSDPSRRPFIEWIKQLTFKVPRNLEPYLFNKSMKVSVPCIKLEL